MRASALVSIRFLIFLSFAGISRSASVIIAYLMKELGLPMLDALTYTRKRRPIIFPNPGFQRQLFEFEKHLRTHQQKVMYDYQEKKRKRELQLNSGLQQRTLDPHEARKRLGMSAYDIPLEIPKPLAKDMRKSQRFSPDQLSKLKYPLQHTLQTSDKNISYSSTAKQSALSKLLP